MFPFLLTRRGNPPVARRVWFKPLQYSRLAPSSQRKYGSFDVAVYEGEQLLLLVNPQFCVKAPHVSLHCVVRYEQLPRYGADSISASKEKHDLDLPLGQSVLAPYEIAAKSRLILVARPDDRLLRD